MDRTLWHGLLVGVVLARWAFVYEYRSLYLSEPLTIIDIRYRGWSSTAGLIGAWMFALYRERKTPSIRKPLRWALAVGTAIYFIGSLLLALEGQPGQKLPELAFTSLEGKTVHLQGFEGRPTVVNLWSTWCPHCVPEMPVLHEAQRQRTDVNFVFLNQGDPPHRLCAGSNAKGCHCATSSLTPDARPAPRSNSRDIRPRSSLNAKGELVATRLGELSAATLNEKLASLNR